MNQAKAREMAAEQRAADAANRGAETMLRRTQRSQEQLRRAIEKLEAWQNNEANHRTLAYERANTAINKALDILIPAHDAMVRS